MKQTLSENKSILIGQYQMSLRDIGPEDEKDVLELHHTIFNSHASTEWYRWKYAAGSAMAKGLWHEGKLIAHCGGLPRIFYNNETVLPCLQIGDSMVAAHWRGILTRKGPHFHVCNEFYNDQLGQGKPYKVGFGFPNIRAWKLGVLIGLGWAAEPIMSLFLPVSANPQNLSSRLKRQLAWRSPVLLPTEPAFEPIIQAAWAKMKASYTDIMLGDRSPAYIRWRYVDRPGYPVKFIAIYPRLGSEPVGFVALSATLDASKRVQWLEWLGPKSLMVEAAHICLAEALKMGATGLTTWGSPAVIDNLRGLVLTEITEVARVTIPKASDFSEAQTSGTPWWLMSGDTDFI